MYVTGYLFHAPGSRERSSATSEVRTGDEGLENGRAIDGRDVLRVPISWLKPRVMALSLAAVVTKSIWAVLVGSKRKGEGCRRESFQKSSIWIGSAICALELPLENRCAVPPLLVRAVGGYSLSRHSISDVKLSSNSERAQRMQSERENSFPSLQKPRSCYHAERMRQAIRKQEAVPLEVP